jgi:hypothetical protein
LTSGTFPLITEIKCYPLTVASRKLSFIRKHSFVCLFQYFILKTV